MSRPAVSRALNILLVEDSPGDVRLTREVFGAANETIHLDVALDGIEAMAFLRRDRPHAEAMRPDLILLDLNLPRMDGRELLEEVKGDHDLRTIPTIILTTSDAEADITRAYELGANVFLTKPVQLDEFQALVASINDFWATKAKLPPAR